MMLLLSTNEFKKDNGIDLKSDKFSLQRLKDTLLKTKIVIFIHLLQLLTKTPIATTKRFIWFKFNRIKFLLL